MTRTIGFAILEGNLLTMGTPTRQAAQRLIDATGEALERAFPGVEARITYERNTSGVTPRPRFSWDASGDDEETAHAAGERAWEEWSHNLSDDDLEAANG